MQVGAFGQGGYARSSDDDHSGEGHGGQFAVEEEGDEEFEGRKTLGVVNDPSRY